MSDALWNGFIGAGGAAICCAVYYGFKAARKGISKIKFSKPTTMSQSSTDNREIETPKASSPKQLTITFPTWRQVFTRRNLRAFGFILLGVICFIALDDFNHLYSRTPGSSAYFGEGYDYQNQVGAKLYQTAYNTHATFNLLRGAFEYIFGIMGGLFLLLGLTGFKFKK